LRYSRGLSAPEERAEKSKNAATSGTSRNFECVQANKLSRE
jgi:hypothetical protein